MAKKKKITYSLTAKQRKQQRRAFTEKNAAEKTAAEEVGEETAQATSETAVATKKLDKKRIIIICAVIIFALALILTAILLPIYLRGKSRYPIVTLSLSNGEEVRIEIWEEDCPIAATNFLWLNEEKYFTNTIFHDVQKRGNEGFVRFGVFENDYNSVRMQNQSLISGLKHFDVSRAPDDKLANAQKYVFGYRLKADSNSNARRIGERGVLSYRSDNPTEFVISLFENGTSSNFYSYNDSGSNRETFGSSLVAFGRIADDESYDNIAALLNMQTVSAKDWYMATDPTVKINGISITNKNKSKWKKSFDFLDYMSTADNGNSAITGWHAS